MFSTEIYLLMKFLFNFNTGQLKNWEQFYLFIYLNTIYNLDLGPTEQIVLWLLRTPGDQLARGRL